MQQLITASEAKPRTEKPRRPPHRFWAIHEKRKIVEETLQPGASVSVIARKYDANNNMVFRWRREYRRGEFGPLPPTGAAPPPQNDPGFIAVGVIDDRGRLVRDFAPITSEAPAPPQPTAATASKEARQSSNAPISQVELDLSKGVRLRFSASLDTDTLRRLLSVIREVA